MDVYQKNPSQATDPMPPSRHPAIASGVRGIFTFKSFDLHHQRAPSAFRKLYGLQKTTRLALGDITQPPENPDMRSQKKARGFKGLFRRLIRNAQ